MQEVLKGSPQWYQEEIIKMIRQTMNVETLNLYRTIIKGISAKQGRGE